MKLTLALFLLFVSYTVAEKKSYTDYSVYKIIPKDELSIQKLKFLEKTVREYDFWTPVRTKGVPVDVMVPPQLKPQFLETMKSMNVELDVKIKNVQENIEKTSIKKDTDNKGFSWDAYHTLDEIYEWLESLAKQNPEKVSVITVGNTYERRNITGVKVSFSPDNAKRSIFIEANIHAREWITNAVATYILNEVLTSKDADFRKIVESFDWYFAPVVNPDGYVYTHTNQRLWRKTRRPQSDNCVGVDGNRNWEFHWNDGGADDNPCSEVYAGTRAFSEQETYSLSNYISSIASNLVAYISFHSYSQLLMIPYGYTENHLDNYNVTVAVAGNAVKALSKRHGTKYEYGNIAETIYVAAGNSLDWVKGKHHVPYAFVYELRDEGQHGFILPPEQIIPTGEETLDSVVVILQAALANPDGK